MESDELIASVYHKIEREKALIHAATNMRHSTDNPLVQQRVDSNIRDGRRNIAYLEEKMKELQLRRQQDKGSPPATASAAAAANHDAGGAGGYYGNNVVSRRGGDGAFRYPDRSDSMPSGGGREPKARPNYSKLGMLLPDLYTRFILLTYKCSDLIKYDTPYLGPKIQLMVSQLEFKLGVEKQYKSGIEKMVRLYQDDGDRRSRSDAENRRIESNQKIQLLSQSLRRYGDLHVEMDSAEGSDGRHYLFSFFLSGADFFFSFR